MSCVFCRVLAGELESSVVHRDDLCTAFLDVQPINPGHLLIVPNLHASYLADLPAETGARMFQVAQRLAAALRASDLRCDGVNFFLADGEAAMREVFHVHLHVFPRHAGEGFALTFAPGYSGNPPRADLERAAFVRG